MAASYKFEIYKDKSGEFRFRFRAPNGEKMFASEGYSSKASAKSTIKSIVKHVAKAEIDDLSDMLGAVAGEAEWLARGDDVRFMNDVALRQQA